MAKWITEVLRHGKRQRGYLDARMPHFGEANVGHLVELFGKVDELETVTIPKVANIQESKYAGYEMIGTAGLSCIVCHVFNGQKPAGLSRKSLTLLVGDVTEICRGRSPAGYRGIGVGYPERINLAFDSGEMALRQLWKDQNGKACFKRTLSFAIPAGQLPFYFRADAGKKVTTQSDRNFGSDKLQLRITSDHKGKSHRKATAGPNRPEYQRNSCITRFSPPTG